MDADRDAQAAAPTARHFVGVYTPGGTVLENWRPTGTELDFTLSPILAPLGELQRRVLVAGGIDMTCAVGEQNQSGLIGLWTGTSQYGSPKNGASGPSIDQVLAPRLSQGKRLSSLELAVRWGTGKAHGLTSPMDIASYADTPQWEPIKPRLDPVEIWNELFGSLPPGSRENAWDKSILDAVSSRYAKLSRRVGAADRRRLEEHLSQIRELELQLGAVGCEAPELVDTTGYDPDAGLASDDSGSVVDEATDRAIPQVGKLMMDMLVMALACDLTSVATLMWSDTEAKHRFPWLGLKEHLHYYMNDGGYHPAECTTIFTWYVEQHAYLLRRLESTPSARGGNLLDETLLFFGSHLQNPANHSKTDMPHLLAGGGGGLRTNRWVTYDHRSHNDLLVSLLNLCGDPRATFGTPQYCTGPLGGLT
jgi:hypothetical protein